MAGIGGRTDCQPGKGSARQLCNRAHGRAACWRASQATGAATVLSTCFPTAVTTLGVVSLMEQGRSLCAQGPVFSGRWCRFPRSPEPEWAEVRPELRQPGAGAVQPGAGHPGERPCQPPCDSRYHCWGCRGKQQMGRQAQGDGLLPGQGLSWVSLLSRSCKPCRFQLDFEPGTHPQGPDGIQSPASGPVLVGSCGCPAHRNEHGAALPLPTAHPPCLLHMVDFKGPRGPTLELVRAHWMLYPSSCVV